MKTSPIPAGSFPKSSGAAPPSKQPEPQAPGSAWFFQPQTQNQRHRDESAKNAHNASGKNKNQHQQQQIGSKKGQQQDEKQDHGASKTTSPEDVASHKVNTTSPNAQEPHNAPKKNEGANTSRNNPNSSASNLNGRKGTDDNKGNRNDKKHGRSRQRSKGSSVGQRSCTSNESSSDESESSKDYYGHSSNANGRRRERRRSRRSRSRGSRSPGRARSNDSRNRSRPRGDSRRGGRGRRDRSRGRGDRDGRRNRSGGRRGRDRSGGRGERRGGSLRRDRGRNNDSRRRGNNERNRGNKRDRGHSQERRGDRGAQRGGGATGAANRNKNNNNREDNGKNKKTTSPETKRELVRANGAEDVVPDGAQKNKDKVGGNARTTRPNGNGVRGDQQDGEGRSTEQQQRVESADKKSRDAKDRGKRDRKNDQESSDSSSSSSSRRGAAGRRSRASKNEKEQQTTRSSKLDGSVDEEEKIVDASKLPRPRRAEERQGNKNNIVRTREERGSSSEFVIPPIKNLRDRPQQAQMDRGKGGRERRSKPAGDEQPASSSSCSGDENYCPNKDKADKERDDQKRGTTRGGEHASTEELQLKDRRIKHDEQETKPDAAPGPGAESAGTSTKVFPSIPDLLGKLKSVSDSYDKRATELLHTKPEAVDCEEQDQREVQTPGAPANDKDRFIERAMMLASPRGTVGRPMKQRTTTGFGPPVHAPQTASTPSSHGLVAVVQQPFQQQLVPGTPSSGLNPAASPPQHFAGRPSGGVGATGVLPPPPQVTAAMRVMQTAAAQKLQEAVNMMGKGAGNFINTMNNPVLTTSGMNPPSMATAHTPMMKGNPGVLYAQKMPPIYPHLLQPSPAGPPHQLMKGASSSLLGDAAKPKKGSLGPQNLEQSQACWSPESTTCGGTHAAGSTAPHHQLQHSGKAHGSSSSSSQQHDQTRRGSPGAPSPSSPGEANKKKRNETTVPKEDKEYASSGGMTKYLAGQEGGGKEIKSVLADTMELLNKNKKPEVSSTRMKRQREFMGTLPLDQNRGSAANASEDEAEPAKKKGRKRATGDGKATALKIGHEQDQTGLDDAAEKDQKTEGTTKIAAGAGAGAASGNKVQTSSASLGPGLISQTAHQRESALANWKQSCYRVVSPPTSISNPQEDGPQPQPTWRTGITLRLADWEALRCDLLRDFLQTEGKAFAKDQDGYSIDMLDLSYNVHLSDTKLAEVLECLVSSKTWARTISLKGCNDKAKSGHGIYSLRIGLEYYFAKCEIFPMHVDIAGTALGGAKCWASSAKGSRSAGDESNREEAAPLHPQDRDPDRETDLQVLQSQDPAHLAYWKVKGIDERSQKIFRVDKGQETRSKVQNMVRIFREAQYLGEEVLKPRQMKKPGEGAEQIIAKVSDFMNYNTDVATPFGRQFQTFQRIRKNKKDLNKINLEDLLIGSAAQKYFVAWLEEKAAQRADAYKEKKAQKRNEELMLRQQAKPQQNVATSSRSGDGAVLQEPQQIIAPASASGAPDAPAAHEDPETCAHNAGPETTLPVPDATSTSATSCVANAPEGGPLPGSSPAGSSSTTSGPPNGSDSAAAMPADPLAKTTTVMPAPSQDVADRAAATELPPVENNQNDHDDLTTNSAPPAGGSRVDAEIVGEDQKIRRSVEQQASLAALPNTTEVSSVTAVDIDVKKDDLQDEAPLPGKASRSPMSEHLHSIPEKVEPERPRSEQELCDKKLPGVITAENEDAGADVQESPLQEPMNKLPQAHDLPTGSKDDTCVTKERIGADEKQTELHIKMIPAVAAQSLHADEKLQGAVERVCDQAGVEMREDEVDAPASTRSQSQEQDIETEGPSNLQAVDHDEMKHVSAASVSSVDIKCLSSVVVQDENHDNSVQLPLVCSEGAKNPDQKVPQPDESAVPAKEERAQGIDGESLLLGADAAAFLSSGKNDSSSSSSQPLVQQDSGHNQDIVVDTSSRGPRQEQDASCSSREYVDVENQKHVDVPEQAPSRQESPADLPATTVEMNSQSSQKNDSLVEEQRRTSETQTAGKTIKLGNNKRPAYNAAWDVNWSNPEKEKRKARKAEAGKNLLMHALDGIKKERGLPGASPVLGARSSSSSSSGGATSSCANMLGSCDNHGTTTPLGSSSTAAVLSAVVQTPSSSLVLADAAPDDVSGSDDVDGNSIDGYPLSHGSKAKLREGDHLQASVPSPKQEKAAQPLQEPPEEPSAALVTSVEQILSKKLKQSPKYNETISDEEYQTKLFKKQVHADFIKHDREKNHLCFEFRDPNDSTRILRGKLLTGSPLNITDWRGMLSTSDARLQKNQQDQARTCVLEDKVGDERKYWVEIVQRQADPTCQKNYCVLRGVGFKRILPTTPSQQHNEQATPRGNSS
ncbi:unnamed protein product [Amoebophrya sp. A120]|nr:unnamed protein product [Amoebophrya sp. A120]|eukprot:GSA120T00002302001.1